MSRFYQTSAFYFLLLLFHTVQPLSAQVLQAVPGGRSRGLADSYLFLADEWAVFQNPAALALVPGAQAGFSTENRFGVEGWFNSFLAAALPLTSQTGAGIGIFRFGDAFYNEHRLAIGAAHSVGGAQIGGRFNLLQFAMYGLNTRMAFTFDAGASVQLSEQVRIGAELSNFTQNTLSSDLQGRLPVAVRLGAAWKPIPLLLLQAEAHKDIDWPAQLSLGMEYELYQKVLLRSGTRVGLVASRRAGAIFSFGLGYRLPVFQTSYAFQAEPRLGLCHTLSLGYTFGKVPLVGKGTPGSQGEN